MNNGPKMDPCGKPVFIEIIVDLVDLKSQYCLLFVKYF